MRIPMGLGAGAAVAAALMAWLVSAWWLLPAAAVLAVSGLWRLYPCRHPHPTLQPPVKDAGPDRDHARWYCHRCGRAWPARLEATSRPLPRFEGYDQKKALVAAARAESLERQRRRLAVERAGLRSRAVRTTTPAPGPRPLSAPSFESAADRSATGPPHPIRLRRRA